MADNVVKIDRFYVSKLLPKRVEYSNKGTYGNVLNVAGSIYYSGAAYLSSIAALKVGTGLVTLCSESMVINRVAAMTPDVTFIDLGQNDFGTIPKDSMNYIKDLKDPSAISIGCGLSTLPPVKEFVLKLFKHYLNSSLPIIIDADAINILSMSGKPLLPLNSVITPHPLELARLLKQEVQTIQEDRVKWAKVASSKFDCIVVLKGKDTIISVPNGNTFINTTGNSSLSKGGTGDILTGMIAGFAACGIKLEDACALSCYIHGKAGELAGRKLSEYSVLASDILDYIPIVIKEFVM